MSVTVKVHTPETPNELVVWHIIQNITNQFGELNENLKEKGPLELLMNNEALYASLRSQMWGDDTVIAQKDDNLGILFEFEFDSQESEASVKDSNPSWYSTLKPQKDVIKSLLAALAPLVEVYPQVQFAVPDKTGMAHDINRPAVWAFVPNGVLDDFARNDLGDTLAYLI